MKNNIVMLFVLLIAACGTRAGDGLRNFERTTMNALGSPPPVYKVGECRLSHSGYFLGGDACIYWILLSERYSHKDAVVAFRTEAIRLYDEFANIRHTGAIGVNGRWKRNDHLPLPNAKTGNLGSQPELSGSPSNSRSVLPPMKGANGQGIYN